MLKIIVRRSVDLAYLNDDPALELDGARDGPARWAPLPGRPVLDPGCELEPARRGDIVGYDLIVAAPRPTSCLLAVGNDAERRGVVLAHRAAVTDALEYLERRALGVRRQVLGDELWLATSWRYATGFTHGINRSVEPHLHDHVVVPSGARSTGAPIDGRALYAHANAADALYRSTLRWGVREHCGRDAWRAFSGIEYLEGIDEGIRATWPGRANDRGPKRHWTREETHRQWSVDRSTSFDGPSVQRPRRDPHRLDEHVFAAAVETAPAISRRLLVEAWANSATFGAPPGTVDRSVDVSYPELEGARGLAGPLVSRSRARSLGAIRDRGPRPVTLGDHAQWPREISREGAMRERVW